MYKNDYGKFDYSRIEEHRKKLNITQEELADWMGVSRITIIKYEQGKSISKSSFIKLISFLNTDTKEELYGNPTDDYGMEYLKLSEGNYILDIPYITVSMYNKFLKSFVFGEPKICLVSDRINSGTFVAFEVRGDAMDDNTRNSLSLGDIAVAKEMNKEVLSGEINPADLWVIIIENDILIRKIEGYIQGENRVACKAINSSLEYADFSLNVSEIRKIYKVTQRITKFLN